MLFFIIVMVDLYSVSMFFFNLPEYWLLFLFWRVSLSTSHQIHWFLLLPSQMFSGPWVENFSFYFFCFKTRISICTFNNFCIFVRFQVLSHFYINNTSFTWSNWIDTYNGFFYVFCLINTTWGPFKLMANKCFFPNYGSQFSGYLHDF